MLSSKVNYFFCKPEPAFNSVEELFSTVISNLPDRIKAERHELPRTNASLRSVSRNLLSVCKHDGGLNHITGHINYIALALGRNTVLTVHDVGSSFTGNILRDFIMKIFWYWLPALRVKRITAISEFSMKELARLLPFAGDKIRVVHNPANPAVRHKQKPFNSGRPRILHIGTKPNKNLGRTVRALKGIPCELVIIGKLGDGQRKMLEESGIVYENDFNLSYEEVIRQYECCDLVCFASTYEGFGMPVLEANAAGRPLVAGNVAAIPEVAGDAACLVDPYDVESIRAGVLKVIENENYRQQLIEKGLENVQRFRPEAIVREYLKVYEEVLGQKPA